MEKVELLRLPYRRIQAFHKDLQNTRTSVSPWLSLPRRCLLQLHLSVALSLYANLKYD